MEEVIGSIPICSASSTEYEFLKQLSPMKRLGQVEEVADLLLYLECAHFVNGEVVHLEGGAHAGKW